MTDHITVNTQSSIRIEAGKQVIYIDPIMIEEERHDADLIFLTHNHYDHFEPETINRLNRDVMTMVVAPKGMFDQIGKETDVEYNNVVPLEPGDKMQLNGFPIEAVHAYNIGKEFHPKENNWLGYVLTIGGQRIYICGDMDATPEAKAVKCDIVLVPCGGKYTMDPQEAAAFVNEIKPKCAIPTHYGSIVGTPEDGEKFAKLVDKGIEVVLKLAF